MTETSNLQGTPGVVQAPLPNRVSIEDSSTSLPSLYVYGSSNAKNVFDPRFYTVNDANANHNWLLYEICTNANSRDPQHVKREAKRLENGDVQITYYYVAEGQTDNGPSEENMVATFTLDPQGKKFKAIEVGQRYRAEGNDTEKDREAKSSFVREILGKTAAGATSYVEGKNITRSSVAVDLAPAPQPVAPPPAEVIPTQPGAVGTPESPMEVRVNVYFDGGDHELSWAEARSLGWSKAFFDLVDRADGKQDGKVTKSGWEAEKGAIQMYADYAGITYEQAEGLYVSARGFSVKNLAQIRAERDRIQAALLRRMEDINPKFRDLPPDQQLEVMIQAMKDLKYTGRGNDVLNEMIAYAKKNPTATIDAAMTHLFNCFEAARYTRAEQYSVFGIEGARDDSKKEIDPKTGKEIYMMTGFVRYNNGSAESMDGWLKGESSPADSIMRPERVTVARLRRLQEKYARDYGSAFEEALRSGDTSFAPLMEYFQKVQAMAEGHKDSIVLQKELAGLLLRFIGNSMGVNAEALENELVPGKDLAQKISSLIIDDNMSRVNELIQWAEMYYQYAMSTSNEAISTQRATTLLLNVYNAIAAADAVRMIGTDKAAGKETTPKPAVPPTAVTYTQDDKLQQLRNGKTSCTFFTKVGGKTTLKDLNDPNYSLEREALFALLEERAAKGEITKKVEGDNVIFMSTDGKTVLATFTITDKKVASVVVAAEFQKYSPFLTNILNKTTNRKTSNISGLLNAQATAEAEAGAPVAEVPRAVLEDQYTSSMARMEELAGILESMGSTKLADQAWSEISARYVEGARLMSDPATYISKAEAAFKRISKEDVYKAKAMVSLVRYYADMKDWKKAEELLNTIMPRPKWDVWYVDMQAAEEIRSVLSQIFNETVAEQPGSRDKKNYVLTIRKGAPKAFRTAIEKYLQGAEEAKKNEASGKGKKGKKKHGPTGPTGPSSSPAPAPAPKPKGRKGR